MKEIAVDLVSDLHGYYPELQGGDLLLIAGDLSARNREEEFAEFMEWLQRQPYEKKVFIAGNHDGILENRKLTFPLDSGIVYLCDSGTDYEGLKIWGSPYTPTFMNWYFMRDRGAPIKKHWDLIPLDTQILITHGPPYGYGDQTEVGDHAGCQDLLQRLEALENLKLHAFGHIHEGYGSYLYEDIPLINCSLVNERYAPVHQPVRMQLR